MNRDRPHGVHDSASREVQTLGDLAEGARSELLVALFVLGIPQE